MCSKALLSASSRLLMRNSRRAIFISSSISSDLSASVNRARLSSGIKSMMGMVGCIRRCGRGRIRCGIRVSVTELEDSRLDGDLQILDHVFGRLDP